MFEKEKLVIAEGTVIPQEIMDGISMDRYSLIREVPGLGLCGVNRFMFTHGLVVGLTPWGYSHRYCYPMHEYRVEDIVSILMEWDGEGFPPGNWVKRKGEDGDLSNPILENVLNSNK